MPYNEALGGTLIERAFRERIVLVGVTMPPGHRRRHRSTPRRARRCSSTPRAPTRWPASCSAATAPDPATYIGKGKAEELRELCLEVDADTVVFDDELTPGAAAQPREAARPHAPSTAPR